MFTEKFSPMGTIHPGIFRGRALWAGSVSPPMNTIASRERFKPIRIGENLVVNYKGCYNSLINFSLSSFVKTDHVVRSCAGALSVNRMP